jgi:hypothetical protein
MLEMMCHGFSARPVCFLMDFCAALKPARDLARLMTLC